MIDLHCHIIPNIDDGAKDMDVTLDMINIALNEGIKHIIATPHYIYGGLDNTCDIINQNVEELNIILKQKDIDINIYPGCEAFICPELPELVRNGTVCTLNNSQYILIEFPMMSIPEYTKEVIYQLRIDGYIPIIAHPERNNVIMKDINILLDFIRRGAITQLNTGSLTGIYGETVKKTAIKLLKYNSIHMIASDAHSARGRAPRLLKAKSIIQNILGTNGAQTLFDNNNLVLNGQTIIIKEPHKIETSGSRTVLASIGRYLSLFLS